jgi:predicted molibdopterin-dependent oxidoreductase YjgC
VSLPDAPPKRLVEITIDGDAVRVPEGSTLLDACRAKGVATPTLCYLETLTPVNACRVCVVELEGSRVLVPACSRQAEPSGSVTAASWCSSSWRLRSICRWLERKLGGG